MRGGAVVAFEKRGRCNADNRLRAPERHGDCAVPIGAELDVLLIEERDVVAGLQAAAIANVLAQIRDELLQVRVVVRTRVIEKKFECHRGWRILSGNRRHPQPESDAIDASQCIGPIGQSVDRPTRRTNRARETAQRTRRHPAARAL
jgi:hypothetical protein